MLKVRKANPDAKLPTRKHKNDAGFDLYSVGEYDINPWSQRVIDTGLDLVEIPYPTLMVRPGLPISYLGGEWRSVMLIWPKSRMENIYAAHVGAGVIDFDYRGPIMILIKNQGDRMLHIDKGQAIAQAVIVPCYVGGVEEVFENDETDRGASGGFVRPDGNTIENYSSKAGGVGGVSNDNR